MQAGFAQVQKKQMETTLPGLPPRPSDQETKLPQLTRQVSNLSRGDYNNNNNNNNNNQDDDDDCDDDEDDIEHDFSAQEKAAIAAAAAAAAGFASNSFTNTGPTWKTSWKKAELETARVCFPEGFTLHLIPLIISVSALTFTGVGGWDCTFFRGATISFTGNQYGLWTLQDVTGKCQLWDVLFFNIQLGEPLVTARVFSMTAMLLGLGLVATTAQASQFHLASWGIGVALFVIFLVSLSTTSIFNVWVVFWLFTYAIMVLIIRAAFVYPVPRKISTRGSRIIACSFLLCALCCLLTLVVLKSDFCTCSNITSENLEDRDVGEPCSGTCSLGWAGYSMIVASGLWIGAAGACLKFGIQPEVLKQNRRRPKEWYAHYPQHSIYTRAKNLTNLRWGTGVKNSKTPNDQSGLGNSNNDNNHRLQPSEEQRSIADSGIPNQPTRSIGRDEENRGSRNSNTDCSYFHKPGGNQYRDGQQGRTIAPTEEAEQEGTDDLHDDGVGENENSGENIVASLDWDDIEDKRSRCQKCCCDYRVEPRTRREMYMFWSLRAILGLGVTIYVLFIYLLIGSRSENTAAAKRPKTTPFFTTHWVCAFNPNNPYQDFQSFETREDAKTLNWTVAHCGKCGSCSNPHDIQTYVVTRKIIAQRSKQCGTKVFLGTYESLADCLEEKIGFTRPCTYCWADNMVSTGEKCLSTCMRTLFSGFMTDNNVPGAGEQGWLNQCLFCDEKISGPNFVTCSGVARRRLGIKSEIERNPVEQCDRVDISWENITDWSTIGF